MNILEHINAGHYPRDEKGRALVPMRASSGDWFAVIYATDYPGEWPILGRSAKRNGAYRTATAPMQWTADGEGTGGCHSDWFLLPPPPRKVEVKVLAIVIAGTGTVLTVRNHDDPPAGVASGVERLVELTGSYEEPWS